MSARTRGFTLIELLIAIVILVLVSGTIYAVLTRQQRLARTQTETLGTYATTRTGVMLVPEELRQVGVDSAQVDPDLLAIGPDSIRYRAWRGVGIACNVVANGGGGASWTLTVATALSAQNLGVLYSGSGALAQNDSVAIFVDTDSTIASDDQWVKGIINGAAGAATTCPGATAIPAKTYPLALNAAGTAAINAGAIIRPGAPFRKFEPMLLRLGTQNGQSWLMAQSLYPAGQALTPVLGPLLADSGFALVFRDSSATVTANRAAVRRVDVTLIGITDRQVRVNNGNGALGIVRDTLTTSVALRNAPRH